MAFKVLTKDQLPQNRASKWVEVPYGKSLLIYYVRPETKGVQGVAIWTKTYDDQGNDVYNFIVGWEGAATDSTTWCEFDSSQNIGADMWYRTETGGEAFKDFSIKTSAIDDGLLLKFEGEDVGAGKADGVLQVVLGAGAS